MIFGLLQIYIFNNFNIFDGPPPGLNRVKAGPVEGEVAAGEVLEDEVEEKVLMRVEEFKVTSRVGRLAGTLLGWEPGRGEAGLGPSLCLIGRVDLGGGGGGRLVGILLG